VKAAAARASRARRQRLRVWRILGHGVAFYRAAAGLGVRPESPHGGGRPRRGRTRMRVRAGLVLEVGDNPVGQAPPISVREGGKEGAGLLGRAGRKGAAAGWAAQASWPGPCGRKEGEGKAKLGWAARKKKREGKIKRESGPGPNRKRGRKKLH
jgi:hypothetical protein